MNTTITQLVHIPRSAAIAGLIVVAGVISLGTATPTHALSLDLGKTVSTVTNTIPIAKDITPLLMTPNTTVTIPTVTTPVVSTPTTTVTTPVSTTPAQTIPSTSNPTKSTAVTSSATQTTQPTTVSTKTSDQAASTQASIDARATAPVGILGLSAITKQGEIAAAAAHTPSPAVTYTSRAINPQLAQRIFFIGIAGIFVGGCIMFAVRPRSRLVAT